MKSNICFLYLSLIAIIVFYPVTLGAQNVTGNDNTVNTCKIRKDCLTSDFLLALTKTAVEGNTEDSCAPLFSTQSAFKAPRWYSLNAFPDEVMPHTMNRQNLERSLADDCVAVSFLATKGEFILCYIDSESSGHEMSTGWLVTYDYDGTRIDSLEFFRQYEGEPGYVSDLSSRLNQDLTIRQTFIDWGVANPSFGNLLGQTKKGTRYDFEYRISSEGHFKMTSCKYYQPRYYSDADLMVCEDDNHPKGIHLGTETFAGTTAELPYNRSLNQFPIYGHTLPIPK